MRILVLGAGATGGYFGGRLAEAGHEVTFLLRPHRAARVRDSGLVIRSPYGDATLHPPVTTDAAAFTTADFIFLTCKAYDLDSALDAIAPAVGGGTTIVPLLNGLAHYDALDARFGPPHVLGGLCSIHATLDDDGSIRHWGELHRIRFGERGGGISDRVHGLARVFADTRTDAAASPDILGALWEKWIMLASMAGVLCLMRADLATVMAAPGGRDIYRQAIDECSAVATAAGHPPSSSFSARLKAMGEAPPPDTTASMLRDLRHGHRVEADHTLGDLIGRAATFGIHTPVLRSAYCHLKCYERSRADASGVSGNRLSG